MVRHLTDEQLEALRAVPVTTAVPNRLRVAMAMLAVTQVDVAAGTNLTQPTISDICKGNYTDLKHSTVQCLAAFFGCAIEDLFPATVASSAQREQPALPFVRRKAVAAR